MLHDYIAAAAGPRVAAGYIARIEAACRSLVMMPERGAPRDDLAPGLRTLAFERRAVIAYRVLADAVEIVAVAYGGRDVEPDVAPEDLA